MSDTIITTNGNSGIDPQLFRQEGAGKAYQSVAQSTAIAVQDAVDNLRNVNTISTTFIGVCMSHFLETKDPLYLTALEQAQTVNTSAAENFKSIGDNSAEILNSFPTQ